MRSHDAFYPISSNARAASLVPAAHACYPRAMIIKHTFVAALLAFVACGGSKPATDTTPKPAADALLAIGELKFYDGDKLGVHLFPDGRLQVLANKNGAETWQDIATVKADGTITGPKGESAHVNADGTITGPKGEVAQFKLDGAALVAGDKRLTIDDKGVFLLNGKTDGPQLRVEGASDAKLQRTALVIVGMLMVPGEQSEGEAKQD
jgi:hypothetical protein